MVTGKQQIVTFAFLTCDVTMSRDFLALKKPEMDVLLPVAMEGVWHLQMFRLFGFMLKFHTSVHIFGTSFVPMPTWVMIFWGSTTSMFVVILNAIKQTMLR